MNSRKPFIVAEISANHLGSLDRAMRLVHAAAVVGADAVKLQTFTPEQMVDARATAKGGPWAGRNLLELYREAHTPREWHAPLFSYAKRLDITAFSSVFHPDDVDFLETLDCPIYKIASFELTDLNLIRYAAGKGKPLIMSTGMASLDEIRQATIHAYMGGCRDLTLLRCASAYPAPPESINLRTMEHLQHSVARGGDVATMTTSKFGLSDHTLGIAVPVAATALGASVIEKHLTLSRSDGGPDAAFSLEPEEFSEMVKACREAAEAIGEVRYGPTAAEAMMLPLRRASGGKRGAVAC